jgi:predicted nucleic acid-binding protein
MTASRKGECRAVFDTLLFVPAMAFAPQEAHVYALLLRKCCKVVVSDQITAQYYSVMNSRGYPGDAIFHEITRLQTMNKLRRSTHNPDDVPGDLAPRKDRHIVAPCLDGTANYIISGDRGLLEKRERIRQQTGARVLDLREAELEFAAKDDCPPDVAGQR